MPAMTAVQLLHTGEILIFTPQYLDLTMLIVMEVLHVQVSIQQPQLKTAYLKIILQESGEEHYTIGLVR